MMKMTTIVRINGETRTFKDANNMRRYVMRFGDKTKKYTYQGTSDEIFINRKGTLFYQNGWKVKFDSGNVYPIDSKTGSFMDNSRYSVKYTETGKNIPGIKSSDDMRDVINRGVNSLVKNRKSKVYVYDKDTRVGKIVARNNYPYYIDTKTKKVSEIYDGGWIPYVNFTPKKEEPKKVVKGWFVMGIPKGKKTAKYYAGEGFTAKKEFAYRFKTPADASKTIEEHLRWMGAFDGWQFFIRKEI